MTASSPSAGGRPYAKVAMVVFAAESDIVVEVRFDEILGFTLDLQNLILSCP